jgi:hypothetical protein
MHVRALESDELHDYTLLVGQYFSKDLMSYMNDKEKVEKRKADRITTKNTKGEEEVVTGIQEDIQTIWEKARRDARTALFHWGVVKESMPKEWSVIERNKAYMPYESSKEIDGVLLTPEQLYKYNTLATTYYAEWVTEYLQSDAVKYDKEDIFDDETGETSYEKELKDIWSDALEEAEANIQEALWNEQLTEK